MRLITAATAALFLLANPSVSLDRWTFEAIAEYEPKSKVTDQNAMDLDQLAFEEQLSVGSDASFTRAWRIYERGGHTRSSATLFLDAPLTRGLSEKSLVTGQTEDGTTVTGDLLDNYPNGISTIEVLYTTSNIQKSYVNCQVGGLENPNLEGCFAQNGTVTIDSMILPYTYDPLKSNTNKSTMKKVSKTAEVRGSSSDDTPYETFLKFRTYYGSPSYADKFVDAALDGHGTQLSKSNANFVRYSHKGRAVAAKTASAYMTFWMNIILKLEQSLDGCKDDCKKTGCNDPVSVYWDEAVAFYAGSLEGILGNGHGKLTYALADQRCVNFKTCGVDGRDTVGTSFVNEDNIKSFTIGSRMLAQAKCDEAREKKKLIEAMMTVPLIQSTLRNAYLLSTQEDAGEKIECEGSIFSAAIIPIVHFCDKDAADTIYNNMKTKTGVEINGVDFDAVKNAFERVYSCIGIRGSDVGGLWNEATQSYYKGAEPMRDNDSSAATTESPMFIYTITTTMAILISLSF